MRRRRILVATAGLILGLVSVATAHRPPTAAINGRAEIDLAGDRAPARRAKVTLRRESDAVSVSTWTGHNGDFQFQDLAEGLHTLTVEKAGLVATAPRISISVKAGTAAIPPVVMQRGGALEGRIVNYLGRPISGLIINAEPVRDADGRAESAPRSATTDDLGRFRIHSLAPGRYRVHVPGTGLYHPGTERSEDATTLTITPGQTISGLDLAAPPPETPAAAAATRPDQSHAHAASIGTSGEVSGRVLQSDTGQPIGEVTVQFMAVLAEIDLNRPPSELVRALDTRVNLRAVTDDLGRFTFSGLPAGDYTLTIRVPGFASAEAPGGLGISRRVTLREAQRVILPDARLAPFGAIEGRLFDEFGDPAPGITLQVLQPVYASGGTRLAPPTTGASILTAPTNDAGAFRLAGLPPGEYHLAALSKPFEPTAPAGFRPTYFPGGGSVDAARAVVVEPGATTSGVAFSIIATKFASVAGVATDMHGRPVARARVRLVPSEGEDIRGVLISEATSDGDGRFEYRDVPEGTYSVQATATSAFGNSTLVVAGSTGGADLPLGVVLKPLVTARGRLVFEGEPVTSGRGWIVMVHPTDFLAAPIGSNALQYTIPPNAALKRDARFEVPNLAFRGVVRLGAPSPWTLRQVRLNGRDITDTPWDFAAEDVNGLEVVVTDHVGSVSGSVQRGNQPAANATVLILGAENDSLQYVLRTIRGSQTDAGGAFSIPALLPGRYVAVALPGAGPVRDPAQLLKLRGQGMSVVVTERADTKIVLTIR